MAMPGFSSSSAAIRIPLTTALKQIELRPLESELDGIVIEVADEQRTQATAAVVSGMLQRLHNGAGDYSLVIPEALLRQSQQTQRIFNIVTGCIAGTGGRHRHHEHHAR